MDKTERCGVTGKRSHRSTAEAKRHLKTLPRDDGLVICTCPHCRYYHVGHKR